MSWGTGTALKPEREITFRSAREFLNDGAYSSVTNDCFGSPEDRQWSKTLDHPLYHEARKKASTEFGFPEDISYDDFNRQT
ncbi:hypothetical protein [Paenibacillus sp. 8b26]|uniref:hypothetical protein n=1 Tax=Paenibacillus sp. 8b26 TaxID=3424133 RepID=UPI003D646515